MAGNAYHARIGAFTADSDARKADRQLLSLVVERGMDAPGRCVVELADPLHDPVPAGEAVTIELDAGAGAHTVFTGEAYASEQSATGQTVRAADALQKLGAIRVAASYEEVATGFVAKDLIDKAGASAGSVADGPKLARCTLHAGPRALRHLGALASLAGADVWTDGAGKVQFAVPKSGGADHRFRFGEAILAIDLRAAPPPSDGVSLWGEGAASAHGADAAAWFSTELSGVTAEASVDAEGSAKPGQAGARPRSASEGALREGAAVRDSAEAWAKAAAARWLRGHIELAGAPEVEPGDLVAIDNLPDKHGAAKLLAGGRALRVRGVRHVLDRARGLRTRLEF